MLLYSTLLFIFLFSSSSLLGQNKEIGKDIVSKTETITSDCSTCPIYLLSQTIALEPGARTRTIIGVGEEVRIYLSGANPTACGAPVSWELTQEDGILEC